MNCFSCDRKIKNPYFLNGKSYGYNCYRQKLALILKEKEEIKNELYSIKCFAAIEILKTKKQNNFTTSIINQYEKCNKLTMLQLKCIIKMFSKLELNKMYLNMLDVKYIKDVEKSFYYNISSDYEMIFSLKNDIRVQNIIRKYNKHAHCIISYKYIDDEIQYCAIIRKEDLAEYKEDEEVYHELIISDIIIL